ncbi:MAG: clostripain, partial [Deltaproteobacteria bacterium]|nr:clostripain [Deltaproteobacteria bacterium]
MLLAGKASADTWAVYMYFCGSDLETRFGAASADIAEAAGATLPPEISVVIQTGGAKQWKNESISNRRLQRWIVRKNQLKRVDEQEQASMGDEKTLVSFLNFCSKNYPADHKILVIWDHGGGSLWGIANDENFDGDFLSLKEVRGALRRVYGSRPSTPPFEIIGFDACLMATLDTASAVQEYARYMVASQEQEPGTGWDYTGWLNALGQKTTMSGIELGRVICNTYKQSCLKEDTHGKATLSVTDLAKIPALNTLYNELGFEALRRHVNDDKFLTAYARCIRRSENYVNTKTQGYTNMADLGSILKQLQQELPEFASITRKMLKAAIPYQV